MRWEQLLESMPKPSQGFSLLLVEPTAEYLQWLGEFLKSRGRGERQVYFPEENSVWIIPAYDKLVDDYQRFLDAVKPRLFRAELYRFGAVESDFPEAISVEAFDRCFKLSLRDEARSITELIEPPRAS